MIQAVVLGNVTLDVLCYPVDDVPRHASLSFERAAVNPGGCGSNVAIGLCALGIQTALVARLGVDDVSELVVQCWQRFGVDTRFVRRVAGAPLAVSVGLVDQHAQPRFVHTPGANAQLTADDLDLETLAAEGARALHVAGYFVLPGLMDARFPAALQRAQALGFQTSLDVVHSPHMDRPESLWPCLPHLDYFLCNTTEAHHLTKEVDPLAAARAFIARGAKTVVVKLGAGGCLVSGVVGEFHVPGLSVPVVDTTGAGDAFAAGLVAARLRGEDLEQTFRSANAAGARIVGSFGTISGWAQE
jgi:sugar/nucleoside kinase (ribokinase family)